MKYELCVGGLFEYSDRVSVPIDKIFESSIDVTKWEQKIGGFEVVIPKGIRNNDGSETTLIPDLYDIGDIEIEIIEPVSCTDTTIWINDADVSDATNAIGSKLWVKTELMEITAVTEDTTTGGYYVTVKRGDEGTDSTYRNAYPVTGSSTYFFTSRCRSFIGLQGRLYNPDNNQLVAVGRVSDEPEMVGNKVLLRFKSELDMLNSGIENDESEITPFLYEFLQPQLHWGYRYGKCEVSYLWGLELTQSDLYVNATCNIKDSESFTTILQLFMKLNQSFLSFSPKFSPQYNCEMPSYNFVSFNLLDKQLDNVETFTMKEFKNISKNIKFSNYKGFGAMKIEGGDGSGGELKLNANNPIVKQIRDSKDFELKIPESFITGADSSSEKFNIGLYIDLFFRSFGRIIQKVEIPTSSDLAKSKLTIGKLYYLSDIADYLSLVSKSFAAANTLFYCTSISDNVLSFLHLRTDFISPIPPSMIFESYAPSIFQFVTGEEFNLMSDSDAFYLQGAPNSDIKYFRDGDLIDVTDLTTGARVSLTVFDFATAGGSLYFLRTTTTHGITIGNRCLVQYQNKSVLSGEQLVWNFLI